jgi:ribosome-associated protein
MMPNRRTSSIVVRYGQEADIRDKAGEYEGANRPDETAEITDSSWLVAVRAAQSKKAQDVAVLDLRDVTTLADYFVILTGTNARQNQAIADEVHLKVKAIGELPGSVEGYDNAEWILMDYGDFIVHIFLEHARNFYDLERLWRHAKRVDVPPEPAAA